VLTNSSRSTELTRRRPTSGMAATLICFPSRQRRWGVGEASPRRRPPGRLRRGVARPPLQSASQGGPVRAGGEATGGGGARRSRRGRRCGGGRSSDGS
jgi:hypothetical protein